MNLRFLVMKTKAILFDKDGTLLDFAALWVKISEFAVREILEKANMSSRLENELLMSLGIENGIARIDGVLAQFPYSIMSKAIFEVLAKYGCKNTLEEITYITTNAYYNNFEKGVSKLNDDDTAEVLQSFKEKGILLFVVTNDYLDITSRVLTESGIVDCFEKIYSVDLGFPPKPDPAVIEHICEQYDLKKTEMIMVGDTLADMEFAKRGGIMGVGIAKDKNNAEILRKNADFVVSSISEIQNIIEKGQL